MKQTLAWIVVSLTFLTPAAFAQAPAAPAAPRLTTYTIAGTVVNSVTNAPVAEARVALVDTRTRKNVLTVRTPENGHFTFEHLPAGKYSLQGVKKGYISSAYEQHEQYSTAIVTGPEMDTGNLRLRLQPTALISGHVRDETGEPVRRASMALFIQDNRAGMSRILRTSASSTDDLGYYDFSNLAPGTYFVSVSASPWYAVSTASPLPGLPLPPAAVAPGLDVAYPTTYYNSATESENASPIALNAGDHAQIDLQLTPVPALHLLVRIPADAQNGFRHPILQKQVFDSMVGIGATGMTTEAPGMIEFTGVAPGKYAVRMVGANGTEGMQITGLNLQHDGEELDATKGESLASLKITLKMTGEEPIPKPLGVALVDPKRRAAAFQQVDPNGEIHFEGVAPGKYSLMCASPRGPYAVTRIVAPPLDSAGHDISMVEGAQQEVTAWVTQGYAKVEGVVQKDRKPKAGVMVVLIPKDPEAHLEYFRRDQSDFDGTFSVAGIYPGMYTIVAVEDAWGFAWLQPGVLSRYAEHGQELTIGPLMRGTVHLPDPVEAQPR